MPAMDFVAHIAKNNNTKQSQAKKNDADFADQLHKTKSINFFEDTGKRATVEVFVLNYSRLWRLHRWQSPLKPSQYPLAAERLSTHRSGPMTLNKMAKSSKRFLSLLKNVTKKKIGGNRRADSTPTKCWSFPTSRQRRLKDALRFVLRQTTRKNSIVFGVTPLFHVDERALYRNFEFVDPRRRTNESHQLCLRRLN